MKKIFCSLLVVSLIACNGMAQMTLKPGSHLDNLALTSTDNQLYNLSAQKGAKGFILVFMSVSCDHCIMYTNRIVALNKKYKALGFPVVAISPYGDDPVRYPLDAMPAMKKWKKEKQISFPYLADQKYRFSHLFGITYTPEAIVLKKMPQGFDIKYIGKIDDNPEMVNAKTVKFVENEVNKLL
jgi:peroxiredoxin